MKKLNFLFLSLVTLILSVLVSCDNGLIPQENPDDLYGTIKIVNPASRFIDANTITKASVSVCAYNMTEVSSDEDFKIAGGSGTAKIENIRCGKNRVISVQAKTEKNGVTENLDGIVMRAVIPVVYPASTKDTEVTVTWSTTARANVFYELIKLGYNVEDCELTAFDAYIPKKSNGEFYEPSLINASSIAADIKNKKDAPSDPAAAYAYTTRTLTFKTNSASITDDDVLAVVSDHASSKLRKVVAGENKIEGIAPGKWTFTFKFANETLVSEELDFTSKDVTLSDIITIATKEPRLEDENGNAITAEDMPLAIGSKVCLAARSYDDEKILKDIEIYYTTDGTEPVDDEGNPLSSAKEYDYAEGITVNKNTTIKAVSKYSTLNPSTVSSLDVTVRHSTPVLTDESGNEITNFTFNEVTTVYLKSAENAAMTYTVYDSSDKVMSENNAYNASTGITIGEKTKISAVATADSDYEESKPLSFSVNVVLPLGDLKITGTTSASRRFVDSNTITIQLDNDSVKDATIIYTKDGKTPSYDEEFDTCVGAKYVEPFVIEADTTIKAFAYKEGWLSTDVVEVSFTRASKLNTPVISSSDGESTFISYTSISLSYSATDEGEEPEIYYVCGDKNTIPTTAADIIASGTLYEGAFKITSSTYVTAVAKLEDWANSDIAGVQYIKTTGIERISFTASNQDTLVDPIEGSGTIDMSKYTAWVQLYKNGESDSIWSQATVSGSTVNFTMPDEKDAFVVALCSNTTIQPDWYAIKNNAGRIYYQTNMNGIPYTKGNLIYTGAFGNGTKEGSMYEPDEQVKVPEITVADGYVTITTATPSASIYYTVDGSEPVDDNGSALGTAIKYESTFELASGVTTVKAAAIREGYETSDVRNLDTTGANDLTFYVGVPATITLPDEDDKDTTRDVTVDRINMALNGNGFNWKEVEMSKCVSSTTDTLWYKCTVTLSYLDGTEDSALTYQTRIIVSGQTKTILYQSSVANGYCNIEINPVATISKKYMVIDATGFNEIDSETGDHANINYYTSDAADVSTGSKKYWTQNWCLLDDDLTTFTNTDPAK